MEEALRAETVRSKARSPDGEIQCFAWKLSRSIECKAIECDTRPPESMEAVS